MKILVEYLYGTTAVTAVAAQLLQNHDEANGQTKEQEEEDDV